MWRDVCGKGVMGELREGIECECVCVCVFVCVCECVCVCLCVLYFSLNVMTVF